MCMVDLGQVLSAFDIQVKEIGSLCVACGCAEARNTYSERCEVLHYSDTSCHLTKTIGFLCICRLIDWFWCLG